MPSCQVYKHQTQVASRKCHPGYLHMKSSEDWPRTLLNTPLLVPWIQMSWVHSLARFRNGRNSPGSSLSSIRAHHLTLVSCIPAVQKIFARMAASLHHQIQETAFLFLVDISGGWRVWLGSADGVGVCFGGFFGFFYTGWCFRNAWHIQNSFSSNKHFSCAEGMP